jgi:V/A-type H+-transporting ATPase subunit F
MKLKVIGSQDAVWGFALVGVSGQIVTTTEELLHALDEALNDKEIGILLVTEDVTDLARQRVDTLKMHSIVPLVVEIPGPKGPAPDHPTVADVVQKTTGVRI